MRHLHAVGAATAVVALALPASTAAHPSVYTGTAKIVTNAGPPPVIADQTRHMVTNHGYTTVLRETNGVGAPGGVMSYALLPGALRDTLTVTEELAQGGTAAQAHATCSGVTALAAESAILGWQEGDPFYNYVPFQKASAGLEDDPAAWIEDVNTLTGVDLSTASDDPAQAATQLTAMCTGIGGTFVPADQTQSTIAALAAGSVAPLQEDITELNTALTAANQAKTAAEQARDAANGALAAANAQLARVMPQLRAFEVTLATANAKARSVANNGTTVELSGPPLLAATVQLTIAQARAKKLGLRSGILARATTTIGANGTADVLLKPKRSVASKLRRLRGSVQMTVTAAGGDRAASTRAILTR